MKNKLLGIMACVVLLLASTMAMLLCDDISFWHQHSADAYIPEVSETEPSLTNWSMDPVSEGDYRLNEYFFRNLAGDMLPNAPLTRYLTEDGRLMLAKERPGDCVTDRCRYSIEIGLRDSAGVTSLSVNENTRSITSFIDYNLLSSVERSCYAVPTEGYTVEDIKRELAAFEKCIYSYDFESEIYGHPKLLNELCFVDYFLLYELAYPGYYSEVNFTLYKDANDRFCLCTDDFVNSGHHKEDDYHNLLSSTWFTMLMKSRKFTDHVLKEYQYLRTDLFSEEALLSELDEITDFMLRTESVNEEALLSQKEALADYLRARLLWLDENIESIREFSALSAVKEYRNTPY